MGEHLSRATLPLHTRAQRRAAEAEERRALGGSWRPWEHYVFPKGRVGHGWCAEIGEAFSNGLYAVLVRYLDADRTGRVHLAIRTPSNREPPWRDLQRIKDELFGPERVAVQVCPPRSRLIDEADMYHLWVLPEGHQLGFGLHDLDQALSSQPKDQG